MENEAFEELLGIQDDEHIEEKQVKIGATAGRHQTMMLNKEEQKEMKVM